MGSGLRGRTQRAVARKAFLVASPLYGDSSWNFLAGGVLMTSNPLKWHGGKSYLARWLVAMMPAHTHYVEPYFGAGSVLFAKGCEGVSEVINDANHELVNFWMVLRDPILRVRFQQEITFMPFSEYEFEDATCPPLMPRLAPPDIKAAVRFFVKYRQSRQGLGKEFATLSRTRVRRGMNEQVSAWLSAIDGMAEACDRLVRVVIMCRNAIDVIREQDGPQTLFYLDPPYLRGTRGAGGEYGEHEMSDGDHEDLLGVLSEASGKFMLSGHRSLMYDERATACGWHRQDFQIDNKASSAKKKEIRTECVWFNFDPIVEGRY